MTNKKTPGKKNCRILLVDDHPVVRQGLSTIINQERDLDVCAEAADASDALKKIRSSKPDLAIIDISLPGTSGIELIKNLKNRDPELAVLVLSMHSEALYAERSLRAGAGGYIMKQEAAEKIITAIRTVIAGDVYLSKRIASKLLHRFADGKLQTASPVEHLSDREIDVFTLIGKGCTTRDVAGQLHISVKTVETHRAHIKDKLEIKSAMELVQHAVRWVQSEGLD